MKNLDTFILEQARPFKVPIVNINDKSSARQQ